MAIRTLTLTLTLLLATQGCDDDSSEGGNGGTDAGSEADSGSDEDAYVSKGACDNADDRAVIAEIGTDLEATAFFGCESAVCISQNLNLSELDIDKDAVTECVANDTPTLSKLTASCQECYVDIGLCVPNECVTFLGGENACSSLPPADFEACEDGLDEPTEDCADCQARKCQPDFIKCSGLDAELP